jgi:hypothetical protein
MKTRADFSPLLWLGLVLFIVLAIAFLLPVTTQDFWWYLRIGRDTLASGSVPVVDALTFTRAGTPVVYHSWGSAVFFWLLYKAGGLSLAVFLRGLLLVTAYFLVWLTARRMGGGKFSSALIVLAAVLATSNNWSMRPQLFAYPLFALSLYILYRWQTGEKKIVFWLPLISLIWVNLHGSFVMLVLLSGATLIFGKGDRRTLGIAFAGILLATLLNPRGPGAWKYVFDSLTVPSSQQFSVEWQPPVNSGWQMNIFFLWLLGFPLLAVFSPRKLDRLEWAWFLGFGFLALWGERYVIWFVLILGVLTILLLSDWEKIVPRQRESHYPAVDLALFILFLVLPMVLLPGLREKWWKQSPPVTEATPITAVDWLIDHSELPGPLWSEIGFSSYLEFALPSRPTWIDTRFEVFPVEQWQAYKDISFARYDWESLLDQAGVNLLMVSVQNQPDLLQALDGQTTWCGVYSDPIAVIYSRGGCGQNP